MGPLLPSRTFFYRRTVNGRGQEGQDGREGRGHGAKAAVSVLRRREPCRPVHRLRPTGLLLGLRQELRLHPATPLGEVRATMARARKSDKGGSGKAKAFTMFDGDENHAEDGQEELPKDEAGRRKIKRQYEELLGIRIEKLRGRILNRERINKTIEGIYFVCVVCRRVCHNLDEELVEDPENVKNTCGGCAKKGDGGKEHKGRAA